VAWAGAAVIAAVTGVAWSLLSRGPDAITMSPSGERDMPLARKGDYLIPKVKPPLGLAAPQLPPAPAFTMGGAPPKDSFSSIENPSSQSGPPPSSVSPRAEATPHHRVGPPHDRDVCAARGMRREDLYQDNHWRSWRCVR
jgi:hypothetical protein